MKLPDGYVLKRVANTDLYFVDGACGFCVAHGDSPEEAISNSLAAISKERDRKLSGGIGLAYP